MMESQDTSGAADGPRTQQEARTARVCAFLLGELSPGEAVTMEAELASDPDLRAEADLLAATIGVVQRELRTEPRLSGAAMTSLVEAAGRSQAEPSGKHRFAASRGASRAAAAALLLVGSALIYLQSQVETREPDEATARVVERLTGPAHGVKEIPSQAEGSLTSEDSESKGGRPLITIPAAGATIIKRKAYVSPQGPGGGAQGMTRVFETRTAPLGEYEIQLATSAPRRPEIRSEFGGRASNGGVRENLPDYWRAADRSESVDDMFLGRGERRQTPEVAAKSRAEALLRRYRPMPQERPRDMHFRYWGDHSYVYSSRDAVATFAADVDTASYNLARRYLVEGQLPTKEQVRTEEFVNVFAPDVPAPVDGTFAVQTELAPSPFGGSEARWMLRVSVRGKDVAPTERDPLALTFVVDVSGSMVEGGRLELVKHALRVLVGQLEARDSIALVAFSDQARLVLPMTPVSQRSAIEAAIHPLAPQGGTNAEEGLRLGYELAGSALVSGTHNRVVFLSDGVANMGETDQDQITADVQQWRDQGIYLNTIGVGMNNHNDTFLEQLADRGDGICDYVDDAAAVQSAIVDRFTGAFIGIASDVKIQVEFDPSQVLRWRQIGYENRAVADADFRNEAVDGGEVGAGHQVTALFEIERARRTATNSLPVAPLAEVRLRWKQPKGPGLDPAEARVTEVEHGVPSTAGVGAFASASPGFQRAALAAQFAEVLRRSVHAREDSIEGLVAELERVVSLPEFRDEPATVELLSLVRAAQALGAGAEPELDVLGQAVEEYRRHHYLTAQLRQLEAQVDAAQIAEWKSVNDALERRIREICLEDARR